MSTEIPKPLQTAMREAGFLDPRAGNPSLNQWSNESGVHTSTISRFIAGGTTRQDNVKKMADALGITVARLYEFVGRAESAPWSPPRGTERLTVRQRQALTELVLAFVQEREGEDDASTPLTRAEGSSAQDDGLGAFSHRDRGDLDHESQNDGTGGNVHELFTPPPPASETAAYRTRNRDKEEEERSSKRGEEPQDE